MRAREEDWDYELDELELGERVADALTSEMAGNLYDTVKDRTWSIVLLCYARMAWGLGPDNVPAQWKPVFDSRGRWHMPGTAEEEESA